MSLPTIKQFRQWTPYVGGGAFVLWTVFLVLLSLFPAGKEAVPGRETKHMPTLQMPEAAPTCTTMDDGLSICDGVQRDNK